MHLDLVLTNMGMALSSAGADWRDRFQTDAKTHSVTIGGVQCSITSSSVASIAFITGPVVTGDQTYSVSISVNGLPISSSIQYGYISNLTPLVTGVISLAKL